MGTLPPLRGGRRRSAQSRCVITDVIVRLHRLRSVRAISMLVRYAPPFSFEDEHACLRWSGHALADRPMPVDDKVGLGCGLGDVTVRFGDARGLTFEDWFLRVLRAAAAYRADGGELRLALLRRQWELSIWRRFAGAWGCTFPVICPLVVHRVPVDRPRLLETLV